MSDGHVHVQSFCIFWTRDSPTTKCPPSPSYFLVHIFSPLFPREEETPETNTADVEIILVVVNERWLTISKEHLKGWVMSFNSFPSLPLYPSFYGQLQKMYYVIEKTNRGKVSEGERRKGRKFLYTFWCWSNSFPAFSFFSSFLHTFSFLHRLYPGFVFTFWEGVGIVNDSLGTIFHEMNEEM